MDVLALIPSILDIGFFKVQTMIYFCVGISDVLCFIYYPHGHNFYLIQLVALWNNFNFLGWSLRYLWRKSKSQHQPFGVLLFVSILIREFPFPSDAVICQSGYFILCIYYTFLVYSRYYKRIITSVVFIYPVKTKYNGLFWAVCMM